MKKNYNQPEILISILAPTTIICVSVGEGDPVPTDGNIYDGD